MSEAQTPGLLFPRYNNDSKEVNEDSWAEEASTLIVEITINIS